MRRFVLIALSVLLASAGAGGQQPNPTQPQPVQQAQPQAAAPPERTAASPELVQVYAPGHGVIAPRVLPMDPSPGFTKECENDWDEDVVLSLLVDTAGKARNIMFLRPAGSNFDMLALQVASDDRFQPGTLNGKPVVVAESLKMRLETCIAQVKDASGKVSNARVFRSLPHQKLEKPKKPPEEAALAPRETPKNEFRRKVTRPDYFSAAKSAPVLIYSADAGYTPTKRDAQINGVCKVSLVVDAHGLPQNVRILKSLDPGLDLSAVAAVEKYRFFPAIEEGQPVAAAIVVDVNFAPPELDF